VTDRFIHWFLGLFSAHRELEELCQRQRRLLERQLGPFASSGTEGELERDLYEFLAHRVPLGIHVMVTDTEESADLPPGTVSASLCVPMRWRKR
jgi:hypothetical protein